MDRESFTELDTPENRAHFRVFSFLLIIGGIVCTSMMSHSYLDDQNLMAAKVQCPYEFVLEEAETCPAEDMLLSLTKPVHEKGYATIGLCVEKEQLAQLKGHYRIID